MGGKSQARKSTPKTGKPGTGTSNKAAGSPRVAPQLPQRQDLGIGNIRPEHVAAIRRSPPPAPHGDDGLGSARTGRTQGTPRNAARRSRKG
jgi:hypothetical protein